MTDLVKAFEHPSSKQLIIWGFQSGFLMRDLNGTERFFSVQGHIGDLISSNTGMPEGCSLSVVAMTVIDWIWDIYQSVFAPKTIPRLYVDNLELFSNDVGSAVGGFVMQEFFSCWGMQLDEAKTYFWATTASDRQQLRSLGNRVELQQADLGGAMTYCARRGLGPQKVRIESLEPLWPRLCRSWASTHQKVTILIQAFWAKAFHAIGITLMPWTQIAQLRTKAVRTLGLSTFRAICSKALAAS